jgi:hypothetical protein
MGGFFFLRMLELLDSRVCIQYAFSCDGRYIHGRIWIVAFECRMPNAECKDPVFLGWY